MPYKDSKLTMMLADALGGGAKTVILVTASPADLDETFFIFDLAGRMSKVKVRGGRDRWARLCACQWPAGSSARGAAGGQAMPCSRMVRLHPALSLRVLR